MSNTTANLLSYNKKFLDHESGNKLSRTRLKKIKNLTLD